jgi:exodeoxyribonuclease VII large subunit
MIRVLRKRFPLSRVRLFAVAVQGVEAPPQIAGAIRYANHHGLADLLIVGRGGGSMEDLWCFNDERVAYAIYQSKIPVISAVGHEPDVTIADYVADLRAATPSNGAELAVPDWEALQQKLDQIGAHLGNLLQKQLHAAKKHLELVKNHPALRDPGYAIGQRRIRLELMEKKMLSAMTAQLESKRRRHISCAAKLDAMSPLKVLSRGYAFVTDEEGKVITGIADRTVGERISVRVSDGCIRATVNELEEKKL